MSAALEKARQAREAMRVQGIEVERLNPIEKSVKNPKSLRFAISAKCWDCSCGQRAEIAACECKKCPLWKVRPYQKGGGDE